MNQKIKEELEESEKRLEEAKKNVEKDRKMIEKLFEEIQQEYSKASKKSLTIIKKCKKVFHCSILIIVVSLFLYITKFEFSKNIINLDRGLWQMMFFLGIFLGTVSLMFEQIAQSKFSFYSKENFGFTIRKVERELKRTEELKERERKLRNDQA